MESIIFAVGLLLGFALGKLESVRMLKDAGKRLELANSKLDEAIKRNKETAEMIEQNDKRRTAVKEMLAKALRN